MPTDRPALRSLIRPAALVAALLALLVALPAAAPPAGATTEARAPANTAGPARQQGQRMVAAFRAWAVRWNVPDAALVVMDGDTVVGQAGRGSLTAATPVPLASLSKAITAVCVARLVDAGRMRFDETLAELIPAHLAAHPPADPSARAITLGQLLTHTSGLGADIDRLPRGIDLRNPSPAPLVRAVLSARLRAAPGTRFHYNSANYVILGLAIEARTGQGYEAACRQRVLAPLGIGRARLNPIARSLGATGGWQMPVLDYARFLAHVLPGRGLIATPPADWPRADLGGGAAYSLGMYERRRGAETVLWHHGQWPGPGGSASAAFVVMTPRLRYVVAEAPRIPAEARRDLERAMWAAAFP